VLRARAHGLGADFGLANLATFLPVCGLNAKKTRHAVTAIQQAMLSPAPLTSIQPGPITISTDANREGVLVARSQHVRNHTIKNQVQKVELFGLGSDTSYERGSCYEIFKTTGTKDKRSLGCLLPGLQVSVRNSRRVLNNGDPHVAHQVQFKFSLKIVVNDGHL
jgi:hypothetical protein